MPKQNDNTKISPKVIKALLSVYRKTIKKHKPSDLKVKISATDELEVSEFEPQTEEI